MVLVFRLLLTDRKYQFFVATFLLSTLIADRAPHSLGNLAAFVATESDNDAFYP
jgi:hypothetical protein